MAVSTTVKRKGTLKFFFDTSKTHIQPLGYVWATSGLRLGYVWATSEPLGYVAARRAPTRPGHEARPRGQTTRQVGVGVVGVGVVGVGVVGVGVVSSPAKTPTLAILRL